MGQTKRSQKAPQHPSQASNITQETFKGLNIGSAGVEPIIRNVFSTGGSQYERERKMKRETLRKAENDMTRALFKDLSKALNNQVKLPFYISEFEAAKNKGIPLHYEGAFGALAGNPTRLTVANGPTVITDLEGVPVLWYFPGFIGKGLQTNLLRYTSNLAQVYRPPKDADTKDRRGAPLQQELSEGPMQNTRYKTRSQTLLMAEVEIGGSKIDWETEAEKVHGSTCALEKQDVIADVQQLPERHKECDGNVAMDFQELHINSPSKHSKPVGNSIECSLADYEPFAYYFSPGWCQTGMQYVRPIQMSLHFRNALSQAPHQTIDFLEGKRLLDKKIALLTNIIQPSLARSMQALRAHMSAIQGPTQIAVINGWTSAFPCYGIAVNRVTGMHRDHRGIRGGLDIIGVLGTFTTGGDLDLPDLNLRLEWTPGCLGAFDGYDFRHKVHDWAGGSRVTLISFCQKATWSSLGLDPTLTRPTIKDCQAQLLSAAGQRSKAVGLAHQSKTKNKATDEFMGNSSVRDNSMIQSSFRLNELWQASSHMGVEEGKSNKRRKIGDATV